MTLGKHGSATRSATDVASSRRRGQPRANRPLGLGLVTSHMGSCKQGHFWLCCSTHLADEVRSTKTAADGIVDADVAVAQSHSSVHALHDEIFDRDEVRPTLGLGALQQHGTQRQRKGWAGHGVCTRRACGKVRGKSRHLHGSQLAAEYGTIITLRGFLLRIARPVVRRHGMHALARHAVYG